MLRAVFLPPRAPFVIPGAADGVATLAPGLQLSWTQNGTEFSLQAVLNQATWYLRPHPPPLRVPPAFLVPAHICRFGVGFSSTGNMVGPSSSTSTAWICSPGSVGSPVGQYDMTGYTMGGIVGVGSGSATGTNVSVTQSGGNTVMSWVWESGVGGSSSRAGISMSGPTYVVWSVGVGSVFTDSPLPAMGTSVVDFTLVPSASPSASPSPVPASLVSAVGNPYSGVYPNWYPLTAGLTLYWNRTFDGVFNFLAEWNELTW